MSSPLSPRGRGALAAFTLIELLTVIAIIGVLAGITFGVMKGVNTRSSISKARSELVAISTALESYKRQYGDYPQTGAASSTVPSSASATNIPGYLFNALAGKLGPKRAAMEGKAVIEFAKFELWNTNLPLVTGDLSVANAFLDPWGNPYIYSYRDNGPGKDAAWLNPSYLLLSAGPDGKVNLPANGILDKAHADNADNIYPN